VWEDDDHPDQSFTNPQRLLIKRAKIDVSIILKESDEQTKFELFQRLNTGGSPLSDQEMRNSLLVMLNRDLFRWTKTLSDDQNFQQCIALSDRAIDEQYDMELVLRFLTFRQIPQQALTGLDDLGEFLTENVRKLAADKTFNKKVEEEAFRTTFRLLAEELGDDSFRRYDKTKKKFSGGFSISAFEVVALGVGYNYKKLSTKSGLLLNKVKDIWSNPQVINNSGAGINAPNRIRKIVPVGRKVFAK
jgi:hypothetical protein